MVIRNYFCAALLWFALLSIVGCTTNKIIHPSELRAYGTDIFSHTFYLGDDENYHYFAFQNGKSFGHWKIPLQEAEIVPSPYKKDGKSRCFVREVQGHTIYLLTLGFPPEDLVFWGTVEKIEIVENNDPIKKWEVTFKVDNILKGKYESDIFSCIIHSPTMSFMETGKSYKVIASVVDNGYYVDPNQWIGRSEN